MTDREKHYDPITNAVQYWEYMPGANWVQVPQDRGDDWPVTSYSYKSWPHGIPEAKKGIPPRIWI